MVEQARALLEAFRNSHSRAFRNLELVGGKVTEACKKVARSWSGSFAGYHARLYYKEFSPPPLDKRFSVEWGGIRGIRDGWGERTAEEVKREIERLAGEDVSIEELEVAARDLGAKVEDVRRELVIILSLLPLGEGMEKEKELLRRIENFKFGEKKEEYVNASLPKSVMTRDSGALLEGICLPAHIYYEAAASEGQSLSAALGEFLKLADQLLRQVQLKKGAMGRVAAGERLVDLHPAIRSKCSPLYERGAYAEAVEKGYKVVRDRLRELTGYETGSEAFGKGRLHIRGAVAPHVDKDFNEAVKFLTMAIDRFRNEKSHSSDAKIDDPIRAYEYLRLSSLAMNLLENAEILREA